MQQTPLWHQQQAERLLRPTKTKPPGYAKMRNIGRNAPPTLADVFSVSGWNKRVLVVLTEHLSVEADALKALHNRTITGIQDVTSSSSRSTVCRRRHQRRFTTAERAEIGEQYQAGRSMNDLARRYGVHRNTILHALQRSDIPIRHRGLSPDRVEEAAELYRAGWSLARLGQKYGCDDLAVRHALRLHGVEIRPRRGWH